MKFKLASDYEPCGDQPEAIAQLVRGVKTATSIRCCSASPARARPSPWPRSSSRSIARPWFSRTTRRSPRSSSTNFNFFPQNAVEYFVSYYDYYQPEAYIPACDTYIEKESTINDELDKLRMSATRSLFERRDVIIVASVSCIYGIGSPEAYYGMLVMLEKGQSIAREAILRQLVEIQYERGEDLRRGTFRVRGDMIEIHPPYEDNAFRIEMWGDQIEAMREIDPLTGEIRRASRSRACRSIRNRTTSCPREQRSAPSAASSKNSSGGSRSSKSRAKSSKRSASGSAPCSTSK